MNQLRLFLIGAGVIARSHARTAQKLAVIYDLEVEIHVADPVDAARSTFQAEFPGAKAYASPAEMLAFPATSHDIAIIATPPFLHRDGALLALQSGRHTLVEKPLALNEAQVLEIAQAAKEADKHWGECSMRLYDMPSTRDLRGRIAKGEIGTPYHVAHVYKGGWSRPGIEYQPQSKWFLDKSRAGGGILFDWGVYDIANLTFLLNPVKVEVRHAWIAKPETPIDPTDIPFDVETHAGATMVWHLEDKNRVTIHYERSSGTHGKVQQLSEIEGSRGAFSWNWAWNSEATGVKRSYEDGKTVEEPLQFVNLWEKEHDIQQAERPLIAFYRRAIRGEDVPATMDDVALFNFRIVLALFAAAETGEMQIVEQ